MIIVHNIKYIKNDEKDFCNIILNKLILKIIEYLYNNDKPLSYNI